MIEKLIKNQKAQSLTEFAMILPLLMFMIMAVLSLGMVIYAKMLVVISSNQSAKIGSEIMNETKYTQEEKEIKIKETALTFLSNGIKGNDTDVDIYIEGENIKVKVTYEFKLFFPFVRDIFKDKMKIPIGYQSIYKIQ